VTKKEGKKGGGSEGKTSVRQLLKRGKRMIFFALPFDTRAAVTMKEVAATRFIGKKKKNIMSTTRGEEGEGRPGRYRVPARKRRNTSASSSMNNLRKGRLRTLSEGEKELLLKSVSGMERRKKGEGIIISTSPSLEQSSLICIL